MKHKQKLGRCVLGKSKQDLKQWLSSIDQLEPYAEQFKAADVTGGAMLAIMSEAELSVCGVSINIEVDKYCLLLNLARKGACPREWSCGGAACQSQQGKEAAGEAQCFAWIS